MTVHSHIEHHQQVIVSMLCNEKLIESIQQAANLCIECLRKGGKILLCGNGGSAADSQHIAAELVGRFKKQRLGMAAIALTTDGSCLTAIANDFGYDMMFARQVEALGRAGDILIGISTSGASKNVCHAMELAHDIGMKTIGLISVKGWKALTKSDVSVLIPSTDTARIQECHTLVGHIICQLIEESI